MIAKESSIPGSQNKRIFFGIESSPLYSMYIPNIRKHA